MILKGWTYEPAAGIDDGALVPNGAPAIVLHTCVCAAVDLKPTPNHGIGWHLYVNAAGKGFQYLDTTRRTGHAFAANSFAVSGRNSRNVSASAARVAG